MPGCYDAIEMAILPPDEIERRLAALPGWAATPEGLRRTFVRKNFLDAVALVNAIAPLAEAADHHPDLLIHGYKRVTCTLTTHSEHGVTEKDVALAAEISRTAEAAGG